MKIPPFFMYLKIHAEHFRMPNIWLPLFLLWPLFAIMLIFAVAFCVCAIAFAEPSYLPRFKRFTQELYNVCCELRGMQVEIKESHNHIIMEFL